MNFRLFMTYHMIGICALISWCFCWQTKGSKWWTQTFCLFKSKASNKCSDVMLLLALKICIWFENTQHIIYFITDSNVRRQIIFLCNNNLVPLNWLQISQTWGREALWGWNSDENNWTLKEVHFFEIQFWWLNLL